MAQTVIWTSQAEEDYRSMQDYLLDAWPDEVAERFAAEVLCKVDTLETMPFAGKQAGNLSAVRQILAKPYCMIYYTVVRDMVIILNLRDTRQEGLF